MGIFNQIENIIRTVINAVYNYSLFVAKTSSRFKLRDELKYAIINLDGQLANYDMGRFSYIISKHCEYAGYHVIIKTDRNYFKRISRYKKPLLQQNYLLLKRSSTPLNSIMLITADQGKKLIHLKYGYDVTKNTLYDCVAAFPLHPSYYNAYPSREMFQKFRNSPRSMHIFFAGNTDPQKYKRDQLMHLFNVNNRVDLLNYAKNTYRNDPILEVISDKQVLYHLLDSGTTIKPFVISEVKSSNEDWLKLLSGSTFFLCAPGVYMPWCHNLTEAMSVGTIPILEYAHLCAPPLVHMENCLAFTGLKDFQKTVELALSLDSESIARMKKNVIRYYEDNLSVESIVKRINDFTSSSDSEVTVVAPFIPAV